MDRHNSFLNLAEQAQSGSSSAQTHLRRKMEPEMMHIVRHALRDGRGRTPLDRRILDEARHAGLNADPAAAEDDGLIRKLAQLVCASVIGALRPRNDAPAAEDTACGNDAWLTRMPS